MDLFEYQGKQFFASYDIPVSPGDVATTVDDAVAVAERIADYPVVVKAQVQVGGMTSSNRQSRAKRSAGSPANPRRGRSANSSFRSRCMA